MYVVETLHPLSEVPVRSVVPYMAFLQRFIGRKPVPQERKNLVLSDQLKEESKEHRNAKN
jgi:hypothetical protein